MTDNTRSIPIYAQFPRAVCGVLKRSVILSQHARLAQLVERHIDIVEVTGSSPVSRTHEYSQYRDIM